jgi:hypothetical protein
VPLPRDAGAELSGWERRAPAASAQAMRNAE